MADGRPSISSRRCRRPPATYPGRLKRVTPCPLLVLLQVGFAEPLRSPGALVRSYRTVSPLPARGPSRRAGGLLSVALSAGRPAWALPSTLPCGARTFLSPVRDGAAVARPTASPFYSRDPRRGPQRTAANRRPSARAGRPLQGRGAARRAPRRRGTGASVQVGSARKPE